MRVPYESYGNFLYNTYVYMPDMLCESAYQKSF